MVLSISYVEFILTLSFDQMNWERSFSGLIIIKSSSIANKKLEAFIIISVEKKLLKENNFQEKLEYVKQNVH